MSGPPKDIPASQLWLKLQEMPRPTKLVDFPRMVNGEPVGELAIRILTQEEQMICTAAAEDLTRKHIKEGKKDELGYDRIFTDALTVELLFRACRDASDPTRPAFPSPKQIREILTTDECATLFNHYLTIQLELGPIRVSMTAAEMEAWVDRLVEGGSAFPFDLISSGLQRLLLLHMAFRLRSSQTDMSSAGSRGEEPTNEIESSPKPLNPADDD